MAQENLDKLGLKEDEDAGKRRNARDEEGKRESTWPREFRTHLVSAATLARLLTPTMASAVLLGFLLLNAVEGFLAGGNQQPRKKGWLW
eukprot:scaffold991_cov227-Pinguiococcus_pyrenoidosus.AAC.9